MLIGRTLWILVVLLLSGCAANLYDRPTAAVSAAAQHAKNAEQAVQTGDNDTAIAELERAVALDGAQPDYYYRLGVRYHAKSQVAEARAAYLKAIAVMPEPKQHSPQLPHAYYNLACLSATAGQADEAFDWLRKAVDAFFPDLALFQSDPDLASLRKDFRYAMLEALLKMRLEPGETIKPAIETPLTP